MLVLLGLVLAGLLKHTSITEGTVLKKVSGVGGPPDSV